MRRFALHTLVCAIAYAAILAAMAITGAFEMVRWYTDTGAMPVTIPAPVERVSLRGSEDAYQRSGNPPT